MTTSGRRPSVTVMRLSPTRYLVGNAVYVTQPDPTLAEWEVRAAPGRLLANGFGIFKQALDYAIGEITGEASRERETAARDAYEAGFKDGRELRDCRHGAAGWDGACINCGAVREAS